MIGVSLRVLRTAPAAAPFFLPVVLALAAPLAGQSADTLPGPIYRVDAGRAAPRLTLLPQPGVALIGVRIALPIAEPAELSGASRVLQLVHEARLAAALHPVGGTVSSRRGASDLLYTLGAPALELPTLADAIARAIGDTEIRPDELDAARRRALREALSGAERPGALARRQLERILYPASGATSGDPTVVARVDAATLGWLARGALARPPQILVAGGTDALALRDAFARFPDVPARGGRPVPPRNGLSIREPEPQIVFPWAAIAYTGGGATPAELALAAELIQRRLGAAPLREAAAEAWWRDGTGVLVVIAGGRAPESRPADVAGQVDGIVRTLAAGPEPAELAAAREALRLRLLRTARTPTGLAELLGEFTDRAGTPTAAAAFLAELRTIRPETVRAALTSLLATAPVRVELDR